MRHHPPTVPAAIAILLFIALAPSTRAADDPLPVLRVHGTVRNVITITTTATALVGGGGFTATYLDVEQHRPGGVITVQRVRCSGSPGPTPCDGLNLGDRVLVRATFGAGGLGFDAAHPTLFDVLDVHQE